MLLSKYKILYVTQKAIKSSALANYLAHQPIEDYQPMQPEFLDEDIFLCSLQSGITVMKIVGPYSLMECLMH